MISKKVSKAANDKTSTKELINDNDILTPTFNFEFLGDDENEKLETLKEEKEDYPVTLRIINSVGNIIVIEVNQRRTMNEIFLKFSEIVGENELENHVKWVLPYPKMKGMNLLSKIFENSSLCDIFASKIKGNRLKLDIYALRNDEHEKFMKTYKKSIYFGYYPFETFISWSFDKASKRKKKKKKYILTKEEKELMKKKERKMIQIFVKFKNFGNNKEGYDMKVTKEWTLKMINFKIEEVTGVLPDFQMIYWKKERLSMDEMDKTVKELEITNMSVLKLLIDSS